MYIIYLYNVICVYRAYVYVQRIFERACVGDLNDSKEKKLRLSVYVYYIEVEETRKHLRSILVRRATHALACFGFHHA
jgi:hypothetical protein